MKPQYIHKKLNVIINKLHEYELVAFLCKWMSSFLLGKKIITLVENLFITLAGRHYYTSGNYYTCWKTLTHLWLIITNVQIISLVGLRVRPPLNVDSTIEESRQIHVNTYLYYRRCSSVHRFSLTYMSDHFFLAKHLQRKLYLAMA